MLISVLNASTSKRMLAVTSTALVFRFIEDNIFI
jgi:hypothetical protein